MARKNYNITGKKLRQNRVRAKISGTSIKPRLSVFRGTNTCFLQLIDDVRGVTLVSAAEHELAADMQKLARVPRAHALGALLAEKALQKSIKDVVFDRHGNKYHGRVQAIAEGAREKGLMF